MMSEAFWRVYDYLARRWYDEEYGVVGPKDRHYQPAMDFLSLIAAENEEANLD